MPIKTPQFWYRPCSTPSQLTEKILSPFSTLYALGHRFNIKRARPKKVNIPVICVGNITAGGSGKTPTIIALMKLINKHSLYQTPHFLTRGYGGSNQNTRCVSGHDPYQDCGDEALLLVKHSKTIISKNRYEGAMLASSLGADCILMDDGFQNFSLQKDLSIIVIDGNYGFGNKKLIPAGPLREHLKEAIERCDAVIIIGDDVRNTRQDIPQSIPVLHAHIELPQNIILDKSKNYIGFAGLGTPQKFHNTLKSLELNIVDFYEFPDHHPYNKTDIQSLNMTAKAKNAMLITTEKDFIRIPEQYKDDIKTLPIELIWDHPEDVLNLLKTVLDKGIA